MQPTQTSPYSDVWMTCKTLWWALIGEGQQPFAGRCLEVRRVVSGAPPAHSDPGGHYIYMYTHISYLLELSRCYFMFPIWLASHTLQPQTQPYIWCYECIYTVYVYTCILKPSHRSISCMYASEQCIKYIPIATISNPAITCRSVYNYILAVNSSTCSQHNNTLYS